MVVQLDNMTHNAEGFVRPNGTKLFPARSCCDLKEEYPDIASGENFSLLGFFPVLQHQGIVTSID